MESLISVCQMDQLAGLVTAQTHLMTEVLTELKRNQTKSSSSTTTDENDAKTADESKINNIEE